MTDRTLHLIVTDYDLQGFVRRYHLNKLWVPKLAEAVKRLDLESGLSAVCYTLLSDETFAYMDTEDILHSDIWRYRAEEFSDAPRRPDDHFAFEYYQGGGSVVVGAVPWSRFDNPSLYDDSRHKFSQMLEGQIGAPTTKTKVGVVIDCTDHPLMQPLLEGMGYKVQRQEIFNYGPWPERK